MSSPNDEQSRASLDVISESQAPPSLDNKAQEELLELERQQKIALLKGTIQDIGERKTYAFRVFCLVVGWLLVIGLMLFLQGFKLFGFFLETTVLVTVVSTTTASVVSIFLIITTYLFPKHP